MISAIELEDLVKDIEEFGYQFVQLNSVARRYEELKKIRLNQIKRSKAIVGKCSEALLESQAYADPEFEKFIEQLIEAEKAAQHARVAYEAKKNYFDAMRSLLAYEREKLNKGIL